MGSNNAKISHFICQIKFLICAAQHHACYMFHQIQKTNILLLLPCSAKPSDKLFPFTHSFFVLFLCYIFLSDLLGLYAFESFVPADGRVNTVGK